MADKQHRVTVLLDTHSLRLLARAAAAVGESKSHFLRAAGLERVREINARRQVERTLGAATRALTVVTEDESRAG